MLDLIEIELTRVRRMAEQVNDAFLLYLIDIAIMEANRQVRSNKNNTPDIAPGLPEVDAPQIND